MTNEKIIMAQRFELMKAGLIGTTGRKFSVKLQDGSTKEIPEPAEIHTYQGWKSRGYQVKKGEKCKAKFPVWVPCKGKKNQDAEEAPDVTEGGKIKMRLKTSFWFSPSQVEPIKQAAEAV